MKNTPSCNAVLRRNPGQLILALINAFQNLYQLCYCKFKKRRYIEGLNAGWISKNMHFGFLKTF